MASAYEPLGMGIDPDEEPCKPTLTPPHSDRMDGHPTDAASSSELSDLEDEEDIGDIFPDHYYEGGKIPVFKPTMDQFRSFKKFVGKIDKYGMRSGIVKVIPPKEWRDALPPLDQTVKSIKVKNPITQEFEGTQGTYVQKNIEKQRSYNLPQWRELSEASNHQPPARRGERRRNQDKVVRATPRTSTTLKTTPKKREKKLPFGRKRKVSKVDPVGTTERSEEDVDYDSTPARPMTPTSPDKEMTEDTKNVAKRPKAIKSKDDSSSPRGRQPKTTVSSRRKYNRREAAETIDEQAFAAFDYRIENADEYTPERCEELERSYWKSITYNSPMYGADMPGSLFDDTTTSWNVAKLENLLDVLGQKIPGVNTAYLYLGMWKSTFAWHLEDVDLYSINYIHFGAPKQWYSISQEDARRFEAAMRDVWPIPAKACSQFLRHKTFLISPSLLQSKYNIKVNRLVHHEGEFVITFPYGYHSGYNIGYNCAESVNFATESWLEYGRVAKKCDCEADSVWVDVNEIERKLRGYETEVDETADEEDDEELGNEDGTVNLPTPPGSVEGKPKKHRSKKRKREVDGQDPLPRIKRIRFRTKAPTREPCMLCPNDIASEKLLPTDNGLQAHRMCALYTAETYIVRIGDAEQVCNVANIDKARLDLKCNFCRSKRGSCFQCSQKKCTRAYHPTCAAAAGVYVDARDVPVFGEDGTEYTDLGIDFRCRYHRPKRGKNVDGERLEEDGLVQRYAQALRQGQSVQMQYHKGEIFAGVVVNNRRSERTILVDVLPKGDRVEVEYKWILAADPADSHLPVPSANARPLSSHPSKNIRTTSSHPTQADHPKVGEAFHDPLGSHMWGDFSAVHRFQQNFVPVKVNTDVENSFWYYLGESSTEAKAQYTEDPQRPRFNVKSVFLDSVRPRYSCRPPPPPPGYQQVRPQPATSITEHDSTIGPKVSTLTPPRGLSDSPWPLLAPVPLKAPGHPPLASIPPPAYAQHHLTIRAPAFSTGPAIPSEKPYRYRSQVEDPHRACPQNPRPNRDFEQLSNGKITYVGGVAPPGLQESQHALITATMAKIAARKANPVDWQQQHVKHDWPGTSTEAGEYINIHPELQQSPCPQNTHASPHHRLQSQYSYPPSKTDSSARGLKDMPPPKFNSIRYSHHPHQQQLQPRVIKPHLASAPLKGSPLAFEDSRDCLEPPAQLISPEVNNGVHYTP